MQIRCYKTLLLILILLSGNRLGFAQNQPGVPFKRSPLAPASEAERSARMVEGIHQFLAEKITTTGKERYNRWKKKLAGEENIQQYFHDQRAFLKSRLGIVDQRTTPKMHVLTGPGLDQKTYESDSFSIAAVRWNVFGQLNGEGYLVEPTTRKVRARIVMIPDAGLQPEVLVGLKDDGRPWVGVASKLARQGCEVIIPVLVNRGDTYSGSKLLDQYTNQPHREWLYRMGYELGRTVTGYELQKVFSAVDWFKDHNKGDNNKIPVGVMGYGEGGLLALHAGALDPRISSTLVSGYFNRSDSVWKEPIYRNTFGTLRRVGNTELAVMNWPRTLIVEHSAFPQVDGPPPATSKRSGAAPGRLITPPFGRVKRAWDRANDILSPRELPQWQLINAFNADNGKGAPFARRSIVAFGKGLNVDLSKMDDSKLVIPRKVELVNKRERQKRVVQNMENELQHVFRLSERTREEKFWHKLKGKNLKEQKPIKATFRKQLWEVIGRLPDPSVPTNPQVRFVKETEKWKRYEVVLDVWPHVFAWGLLTVPKHKRPGIKLPVVVCQHGLEGLPRDVVSTDPHYKKYHYYKGFASQLADQGYITFAPHNPYRGGDKFRVLQRMANPIGYSLFSVIIGQHQRILQWLQSLSMVDPQRIGFYGLSYGGKTAMRVPAVLTSYALSIASGDFNAWIRKNVSTQLAYSYMFTYEYEMPEWDLGHTFSYAEMAALIAPRPFMVERGHWDGVSDDKLVAYEYAKVRRYYDLLGIGNRTAIEFFNGPHQIHGVGTFKFLHKHLPLPNDEFGRLKEHIK